MSAPMLVVANNIASPSEYARAYRAARNASLKMSLETRRIIASIYEEAADEAAEVVRDSLERGLSELTSTRWAIIESRLRDAADAIAEGTENAGRGLVTRSSYLFPEMNADWMEDVARLTGASGRLTRAGLERVAGSIQERVVASLATRLWADGKTFSEHVWGGVRDDWFERVRMTVAAGIAQGRDPAKIAKDIQIYTVDGKVALLQRWGGLVRGTGEFSRRLPGRIDWRAVRLVRSEFNASMQDSEGFAAAANPGCTGDVEWVLQEGRQHWGCECEDLAAGGPYPAEDAPTYPHPNCQCWLRPVMRDHGEFMDDLKRWVKGGDVDYLDKWYRGTYKTAGGKAA